MLVSERTEVEIYKRKRVRKHALDQEKSRIQGKKKANTILTEKTRKRTRS